MSVLSQLVDMKTIISVDSSDLEGKNYQIINKFPLKSN
jgi:hypothetical protein